MNDRGERYAWAACRRDAKRRGYEFDISYEFFRDHCHLPCHYCGRKDGNRQTYLSGLYKDKTRKVLVEDFRFNSLDRVDNTLGYLERNCVPCCKICNRAKNNMSYEEFIEWIEAIKAHLIDRFVVS